MKKEYSLKFNVASSSVQTSDGNKNVSDVFFFALGNGIGAHYEYAPFGAITRTSSATHIGNVDIIADNPFRFSSEFYDPELDLVYYNYRHYSPALGRFLSRDPIEEQGGRNLYAFVGNAPVKHMDIIGLQSVSPGCVCPKEQQEPPIGIEFPEEDPDIFTNLLKEIFKELFLERALTNPDDYYFERMKDFSEFRKNENLVFKIGVGMKYGGFSGGGNVRWSPEYGWEPGVGAGPVPGGDNGEPGGFINIKITWRF